MSDNIAVDVSNTSISEANSQFHFWLNFLTAEVIPEDLPIPDTSTITSCEGGVIAGPGCSNPTYP